MAYAARTPDPTPDPAPDTGRDRRSGDQPRRGTGFAGLAIGLVVTVIHLVGIPLDGTSVNPARSIGPALFNGGDSLAHLWVFIVLPLVGGAVAAVVAPLFETAVPKSDVDPTGATVPEP